MRKDILDHYKLTGVYTYAEAYNDYIKSLPDDIPTLGLLVCGQVTHPSMFYLPASEYLENKYFGKINSYHDHRFKNEDELFMTTTALMGEIFRLDSRGFTEDKDVNKRVTVSCRQVSVLFSAILKAKGIPCRSRTGFIDFDNDGASFIEHWVNEYWNEHENRWVLVDSDGYYEYEKRFGYSQFDLPSHKFIFSADAWLGLRGNNFSNKLVIGTPNVLEGVCQYLFADFHALMNNEIFYTFQPEYLYGRFDKVSEEDLEEIDELASLLQKPDHHFDKLKSIWETNKKFIKLTNYGHEVYKKIFNNV